MFCSAPVISLTGLSGSTQLGSQAMIRLQSAELCAYLGTLVQPSWAANGSAFAPMRQPLSAVTRTSNPVTIAPAPLITSLGKEPAAELVLIWAEAAMVVASRTNAVTGIAEFICPPRTQSRACNHQIPLSEFKDET